MSKAPLFRSTSLIGLIVVAVLGLALSFAPRSIIDAFPPELQQAADSARDLKQQLAGLFSQDSAPSPVASGQAKPPGTLPDTPGSFSTAKRILYEEIHGDRRVTFYCGCSYDRDRDIDLNSCGLEQHAGHTRAERVEAEHIFPASQFGNFRICWRQPETFAACRRSDGDVISGRSCCERVDPVFEAAHNDLHNLVPANGLVNGDRSNHNWGMVPRSSDERYGNCGIRTGQSHQNISGYC